MSVSALNLRCMNVKYSPNLGDGLLSECLEATLISHGAAPTTWSIDLAARQSYGQTMAARGAAMTVLDAMPATLRNWAVRAPLALQSKRKWEPHYRANLEGADAMIIGGGNLLSDHDLNFPTKIALALRAAKDLPKAIYACGMASHWTTEGDRRLRRVLNDCGLGSVFLRDTASAQRWDERFGQVSGCMAQVVRDPGLLARDTYGAVETAMSDRPVIGVGIMSHVAIRYHAQARLTDAGLLEWYVTLARQLVQNGARVVVFINGAPEDRMTLDQLRPALEALGSDVSISIPGTPRELAQTVGGCDAIVAYRMHAIIAAYSYAVPAVALKWDDKVDAFMASVERSDHLIDPADVSGAAVAKLALQAADDGLDEQRHKEVTRQTRADVGKVLAALS